jgi:hypothetical protein
LAIQNVLSVHSPATCFDLVGLVQAGSAFVAAAGLALVAAVFVAAAAAGLAAGLEVVESIRGIAVCALDAL